MLETERRSRDREQQLWGSRDVGGALEGLCAFTWPSLRPDLLAVATIDLVAVREDSRRRGLGTEGTVTALRAIQDRASLEGATALLVRAECHVSNAKSEGMLRTIGFRVHRPLDEDYRAWTWES